MNRTVPGRYAFVDWYRGLACVLMIQTHVYDSYLARPYRAGWFWALSNHHLGGLPARLFLFLAGVSVVLRWDGQLRRGESDRLARRGVMRRGLEVLGLGLLFRLCEWALYGARLDRAGDLLRVDVLNCIGVSMIAAAVLLSPSRLLAPRGALRPLVLGALLALFTPLVEALHLRAHLPAPLAAYLAGPGPLAQFPLCPWLAYLLTGCGVCALWLRRRAHLDQALFRTALVGLAAAVVGQLLYHAPSRLYPAFTDYTTPTSYLYRSGVILCGVWLSSLAVRWLPDIGFSPLRTLGAASLFVYWVHVELVYGHASDALRARLTPAGATVTLLCGLGFMVGLSALWLRRKD